LLSLRGADIPVCQAETPVFRADKNVCPTPAPGPDHSDPRRRRGTSLPAWLLRGSQTRPRTEFPRSSCLPARGTPTTGPAATLRRPARTPPVSPTTAASATRVRRPGPARLGESTPSAHLREGSDGKGSSAP